MNMSLEIMKFRLQWLGLVLRMPNERIPKVALRWTTIGRRKRGKSKATWQRTTMIELEEMGLSWDEAQTKTQDRVQWLCIIKVIYKMIICPSLSCDISFQHT